MLNYNDGFICLLTLLLTVATNVNADAELAMTKQEAEYHCQGYVERALAQNQQNKQFACGYSGLRWNDNREGQYQWCLTAKQSISHAEDDARNELLKQCFTKKTSKDNPENHPAIPAACVDNSKEYQAVKNIYSAFRYEKTITTPVENGLIRYDYNQDNKDDFLFLELKDEMAHLSACMSQPDGYQRKQTGVIFYAPGGSSAEQYQFLQQDEQLQITINQFAHNEGSSFRSTHYRYNTTQQAFEIVKDTADSSPVEYDGQPYPMGSPQTPDMTFRQTP